MIDISTLLLFLIVFFLILFLLINLLGSSAFSLVLLTLRSIRSPSLLPRSFAEPLGKARLGSLVPLVQLLLVLRLQHLCPHHLPASLVEALPVRIRPRVRPSLVLREHPDSWRVLPRERLWVETPLGRFLSQLHLLSLLQLLQFVVLVYPSLFTIILFGF